MILLFKHLAILILFEIELCNQCFFISFIGEFRRGLVMKVSTQKQMVLVQHLDHEGQTTKVDFPMIRPMIQSVANYPCQALPYCQLEGVTDPDTKNALLKPYMQLAVQMQV